MEIAAQKNANQTALAAIGPYKKRKVDKGEPSSSVCIGPDQTNLIALSFFVFFVVVG